MACVQTLSRLNRTTAGKEDAFVLGFEKAAEDIEGGFEPFYDRVTLSREINATLRAAGHPRDGYAGGPRIHPGDRLPSGSAC